MSALDPVLALIPARGGSKGVPHKNLSDVGGLSLTARAVQCARTWGRFDRIVVSTDSDAIAANAAVAGAEVIHRPAHLATDSADVADTIDHALEVLAGDGFKPEVVVLLEPSCPLRTSEMIDQTLEALADADAAFTVSAVPSRFHPRKQFAVDGDGMARYVVSDAPPPVRRQELSSTFVKNGAVYAFRTAMFRAHRSVLGPAPRAVVIAAPLVNIDSLEDLTEARRLAAGQGGA